MIEVLIIVAIIVAIIKLFEDRVFNFLRGNIKDTTSDTTSNSKPLIECIKKDSLCTQNEKNLLEALKKAVPSGFMIHCQVSLISLIEPKEFKNRSKFWAKRMDYVITDEKTNIVCVIELDDSSHHKKKRQERDSFIESVLDGKHPLVRFKTKSFYKADEVGEKLENLFDENNLV